jgi:hypothetical protein
MKWLMLMALIVLPACATPDPDMRPPRGTYADYEDYLWKHRNMAAIERFRKMGVPDDLALAFAHCYWAAEKERMDPADVAALDAFARGEADIPLTVLEHVNNVIVPDIKSTGWDALRPYCPDKIEQFRAFKFAS